MSDTTTMTPEQIRHIAAQLACPSGEAGTTISEKMNRLNGFITSRCLEALNPTAGQTILEIGPGNGALSEPLIDTLGNTGSYHAVERSTDMATITYDRLSARAAASIQVHCGDCDDAAITEQSLDGVFAVNLLYFIKDLGDLFSTLQQWLRPGGKVVFGVRTAHSLRAAPFTEFGFHIRELEDIISSLNQAGFTAITTHFHDEGSIDFAGMQMPVESLIISAQTPS